MLAARLVLRTVRGVETKGWRARRLSFEPQRLALTVVLEDDTEQHVCADSGSTLLEALERSDFSDVWEGGACERMRAACACENAHSRCTR